MDKDDFSDPLHPSPTLLCHIVSALIHAEELVSPSGHPLDLEALRSVFDQPELREWIMEMTEAGFAPVKR